MQRRHALPAAVAVALLALTGCDQSPGTAASVGDTTISTHDVELMTQVLCVDHEHSPQRGAPASQAVSAVRGQAVQMLVSSALDAMFAAKRQLPSVDSIVSRQMAGFDSLFKALPAADRAPTRELIRDYFTGQVQLQQLGATVLQGKGKKPTAQSALQAGLAARKPFDRKQQITVNPRYRASVGTDGSNDGAGSISTPVSDFAKSAASAQPDPGWASGLPRNQRCG